MRNSLFRNVSIFLIALFLINVVFLPNDTFYLKKMSFLLIILFNLGCFYKFGGKDEFAFLFFSVVLPTYIIFKSYVQIGNFMSNFLGGFTGYLLLIYFVIKRHDIDFEKMFMMTLLVLAYFIDVMALLDFVGILPALSNPLLMWFYNTDNAMIGRGTRHAFGFIYFMKSSPMLMLCLPWCIEKKKKISAIIVTVALVLSGTRANLILGIVLLLACLFYEEKNIVWIYARVFIGVTIILAIVSGTNVVETILNAFSMKVDNDKIRNLSLMSIITFWQDHPLSFIFGSGYASSFYNLGRFEFVSNIELSYWNLLRRVGLTIFAIMMFMFLYPLKNMKFRPMICFGYIAYLVVAYTNPLLYTSTGITVLLYMYVLNLQYLRFDESQIVQEMNDINYVKKRRTIEF